MTHHMFGNIKGHTKKRNTTLIIADFDGTIFCRKEQLEKYKILRKKIDTTRGTK